MREPEKAPHRATRRDVGATNGEHADDEYGWSLQGLDRHEYNLGTAEHKRPSSVATLLRVGGGRRVHGWIKGH
jgi:hypothetical protein